MKRPNIPPSTLSAPLAAMLLTLCTGLTAADFPSVVKDDGPVLYYRFSDPGVVSKFTIATNAGTLGSTADGIYTGSFDSGVTPGALAGDATDKAVYFFGGDVSVPYSSALNPSGAFSAEVWLKPAVAYPAGTGVGACAWSSVEAASPRSGWLIYQTDTGWNLRVYNQNGTTALVNITAGGAPSTNNWYHVVATFDGQTATIYVNGTETNSSSASGFVANVDANLTIGQRSDLSFAWSGTADEAAIYSTALSAATILAHYQNGTNSARAQSYQSLVLASNPIGYWRLDEPPTVYPTTANSGTLGVAAVGAYLPPAVTLAGPQPPTFPGFEAANTAVGLDGTNALVRIPPVGTLKNAALTNVTEATFLCWVQRNGAQGEYKGLFAMRPLSTGLYLNSDNTLNYSWNDAANTWGFNSTLIPPDGEWTLATVVVRPDSATFYMQSVSGGFATAVNTVTHGPSDFTTGPFAVGKDINFGGRFFKGNIDEAALFTMALPEGRIRSYFLTAVGDTNAPTLISSAPIVSPAGTLYATTPFSLTIDAYASSPTYQWRKDGTNIVGATNFLYSVARASVNDNGNYDVIVSNSYGALTSSVVAIAINPAVPPTLTQPPASRLVYPGGSAFFSVVASGTPPFSYQWTHAGTNLPGATAATLWVSHVDATMTGNYSVTVTNVAGRTVSPSATLTLLSAAAGSYPALLTADRPVGYWRLGETSGSTTAYDYFGGYDGVYNGGVTLGTPGALRSDSDTAATFDGASGYVLMPTLSGSVYTNVTSATFLCWVNRNGPQGNYKGLLAQRPLSIGLYLNGDDTLNYSWNDDSATWGFNSGLIPPDGEWTLAAVVVEPSQTTFYMGSFSNGLSTVTQSLVHPAANFTTGPLAIARDYNYGGTDNRYFNGSVDEAAVFTNALSAAQIEALFYVGAYGTTTAPFIISPPAPQTVVAGSSFTLSLQVGGSLPLTYQWQKGGTPITGATNSVFTIPNAYYTDSGSYSVQVTNSSGMATSTTAQVTVLPPPSFANLTNGLVLHLSFEGDQLTDSSGNGNNGTASGSPTFVPGMIGTNAVYLNTVHANSIFNYVYVSQSPSLDFSNSFSVSFWVKYTGLPNDLPMIGNAINSTFQLGWVFTDDTGKIECSLVSVANSGAFIRDPLPGSPVTHDDQWHHVLGIVDRGLQLASAYVDGTVAGTWSIAGLGPLAPLNNLTMGQDPTGAYGVDGAYTMDDVGIWERPLSAYEAASIYAAGQRHQSFDVIGPVKVHIYQTGAHIDLAWQAGTLLQSTTVSGPYTPVPGATAPFYRTSATGTTMFFRVSQ